MPERAHAFWKLQCSGGRGLSPLERASATVGRALRARRERLGEEATLPLVIYQSTVYPGATEEV